MKYILIPILIFSSLGFTSCSVDLNSKSPATTYLDRVTASDNTITQKRTISTFEAIDISSAINVTVNEGSYNGEITIEAPDNIMDRIVTEVENGVLVVKIKGTVSLKNEKIKVTFPHQKLRGFNVSGASNVTVLPTMKVVCQLAIMERSVKRQMEGKFGIQLPGLFFLDLKTVAVVILSGLVGYILSFQILEKRDRYFSISEGLFFFSMYWVVVLLVVTFVAYL